ncbi:MAG: 50S ribosomal protein L4 [Thermoplasmata archaeon]|nr:50S ribosomal protein L4 [Thermoplasmata archaeon]
MSAPAEPVATPSPAEHSAAHRHRVHVLSLQGKPRESLTLPAEFSASIRADLVQRAVVAAASRRRQPHGTGRGSGRRHSVEWSGKGQGVARTPRLMGSMRGAQSPNTVGGAAAHPPRAATIWAKSMNWRERRLAFAAALAATREPKLARARGHRFPDSLHLPVVLEDPLEEVGTAQEANAILTRLDLAEELTRARDGVHVRAGRGKRRGRRLRKPRSLLVVVSGHGKARGFRNFPGVDVVAIGRLSTEDLAPGGVPGRLTVFTPASLSALASRLEQGA